jgi:hypothetical protein
LAPGLLHATPAVPRPVPPPGGHLLPRPSARASIAAATFASTARPRRPALLEALGARLLDHLGTLALALGGVASAVALGGPTIVRRTEGDGARDVVLGGRRAGAR